MLHIMCFFSYLLGFVTSNWQGIDWISFPPHSNYSYSVQAGVSARIDMINIMIIGLFENPLVDLGLVNQLGSKEQRVSYGSIRKSLALPKVVNLLRNHCFLFPKSLHKFWYQDVMLTV
ncbi:Beta-D-glucosidase protein [Spatholobus suberectus]|nr:Beta-D-glucosidase protein [Spatholobus suberectus]